MFHHFCISEVKITDTPTPFGYLQLSQPQRGLSWGWLVYSEDTQGPHPQSPRTLSSRGKAAISWGHTTPVRWIHGSQTGALSLAE